MATKKPVAKATKKKETAQRVQGTRVHESEAFIAPEMGEKPKTTTTKSAEALVTEAGKKTAQTAPVVTEDKIMKHLKLHGKEFVGVVISDKATKTVTVEWERRVQLPKYERYERRYSRVYAHNPLTINARMGDTVRIKETRPLSKTKNFVVTEIIKREADQ